MRSDLVRPQSHPFLPSSQPKTRLAASSFSAPSPPLAATDAFAAALAPLRRSDCRIGGDVAVRLYVVNLSTTKHAECQAKRRDRTTSAFLARTLRVN
jgi:hypothetical protein